MVINTSVQDINYAMKPALHYTAWGPLDKPVIMSFSSLNENGKVKDLKMCWFILVAKRKACLQPEKAHGYQYIFAVRLFNFYAYRDWVNKGHLGGLAKVLKNRDRHHRICRKILRKNEGLTFILPQS